MNTRLLVPLVLFVPALAAQEHKIAIKPPAEGTRFTIESSSKVETTMKMLRNGEEVTGRGGRGGGGGGRGAAPQGPVSTSQKVVFVDGGSWRTYETAEGKVTRPGWDGETNEQAVTGELQGQKVTVTAEPAVLGEDGNSTPLSARAARGIPKKVDLGGLAPSAPVALQGTYEVTGFSTAIASLVHPIRPRMEAGGGGGRAARRGEGGEGAGDAGGEQGRGGRGAGRGGFRGAGGADNPGLQILTAEGVQSKIVGKLTKVEGDLATISLSGTVSGKGDPAKLGLSSGMNMGGRGRRGGEGEQQPPQGESDGSVTVEITGTMVVDTAAGVMKSLDLTGQLQSKSNVVFSFDRGGETTETETDTTQKGSSTLKGDCGPAK